MTLTYLQSQTGNDTDLPAKSDGRVVTPTYLQSRAGSHSGMNQASGCTSLRSDRVWLDTGSPPTDKTRLARTGKTGYSWSQNTPGKYRQHRLLLITKHSWQVQATQVTRDHKTLLASTGNTGYSWSQNTPATYRQQRLIVIIKRACQVQATEVTRAHETHLTDYM